MDIEQLKQKNVSLHQDISKLLVKFEAETGVKIKSILTSNPGDNLLGEFSGGSFELLISTH